MRAHVIAWALFALTLGACSPQAMSATPNLVRSPAITPTVAIATSLKPSSVVEPVVRGPDAKVTRVIDGDTIEITLGGQMDRVRLILVDTPETVAPGQPVGCFGPEASAFTKSLLTVGLIVTLEKDVSERDRFDRLLRYVYLPDGRMLNEVLIAEGYAQVATFPPDVKYVDRMLAAQRAARDAGKGLWTACAAGPPATTPPSATRVQASPAPSASAQPATVAAPALVPANTALPQPTAVPPTRATATSQPVATARRCDPSYPDVCIPPYPPDLNCKDVPYKRFRVVGADPHRFDADHDGIGCE